MVQPKLGAQECAPMVGAAAGAFTLEALSVGAAGIARMVGLVALNSLATPTMGATCTTLEVSAGTDEEAVHSATINLDLAPIDASSIHLCLELDIVTSGRLFARVALADKPNHALDSYLLPPR
jgi:hypothetical protein